MLNIQERKMFQRHFEIYFMFYIFIQIKFGASQENKTVEPEPLNETLPIERCALKNCSCEDLLQLNAICVNDELMGEFFRGRIFLTFNDETHFPEGAFRGLSIHRLDVNNSMSTVHENVFDGILFLKMFVVERSSIQIIPDFSPVRDTIHSIFITSSRLTALDGNNLQNLTILNLLDVNRNSIRFIDPDVLKGTEKITNFRISNNLLTFIPPKLLEPLKNLYTFDASCNNLQHVDDIFFITVPIRIKLGFNNIKNATSVLQQKMEKVEKLIQTRIIIVLGELRHCTVNYPGVIDYYDLFRLDLLDLSYNSIQDSSIPFMPCYTHEWINANEFALKVSEFKLTGNKLKNLNVSLRHLYVKHLIITKNEIQFLSNEDFLLVHDTIELELQENRIQRIGKKTFKPLRLHLQYLDLSSNLITSLNGSIQHLFNLKRLKLEHNSIQTFQKDEFRSLDELSELYLQYNKIKDIGELRLAENLRSLNIAQNDVRLIRPDMVAKTLIAMDISGNPFVCECLLQPFIYHIRANEFLANNSHLCLSSKVPESQRKYSNCPSSCSCRCVEDEGLAFILVDCSSKNLSVVPHFLRNNLTVIDDKGIMTLDDQDPFVMNQNEDPFTDIHDRVLGINLEDNSLEYLNADQLPPKLIQLYLANNRLKWLPDSIFEFQQNLKDVSLSGNPWICDCRTMKFKKWLTSKSYVIRDINNTRCGESAEGKTNLTGIVIWTLTDFQLCPSAEIELYISISFAILIFLTLCSTAKVLYNRYELNIKVFLYYHGLTFVKEEDLEFDKEFDAFISFSHKDDEFAIKEIVSGIEEKDPNIHLCIHYRHFKPGEFIYDNIILAVQKSKRSIIILTRNFLESEWCLVEFRAAHLQMMEDKIHRVIIIKVGDLPEKLDPTIETYLKTTTYLTWGERNFWRKLIYILPSGCSVRNTVPRRIGDNETVLNNTFYED